MLKKKTITQIYWLIYCITCLILQIECILSILLFVQTHFPCEGKEGIT